MYSGGISKDEQDDRTVSATIMAMAMDVKIHEIIPIVTAGYTWIIVVILSACLVYRVSRPNRQQDQC